MRRRGVKEFIGGIANCEKGHNSERRVIWERKVMKKENQTEEGQSEGVKEELGGCEKYGWKPNHVTSAYLEQLKSDYALNGGSLDVLIVDMAKNWG